MFELRPYQQALMDEVRVSLRTHQSVCLQLATGGGKTAIAGAMTLGAVAKMSHAGDEHLLYLVHRRELLAQVCATLTEFGLEDMVGRIAAGAPVTPWAPLQVASVQTLTRRVGTTPYQWLKPKVVFIDEAHHARATTWEKVLEAFPRARRIGLTATPARLDGKGLGAFFDALVCGPPMRQLIQDRFLADFDIYSTDGVDLKGVHRRMGEYSKRELDERMDGTVVAKVVDNWARIARDRRTLHFAVTRRHSRDFVERVNQLGIRAEHVDGDTPKPERDAIFRRFAEGVTPVISNVALVNEGFDMPACEVVVMRPTASLTEYMQQAGRMMRPKPDGGRGILIDPGGNLHRHGDPRDPFDWTLEGGVEWEMEKSAVSQHRICKRCDFYYGRHISACPACGHVPQTRPVLEVDVELQKMNGSRMEKAQKARYGKLSRRELSNEILKTGGNYEKLLALQRKYGYKSGFAHHWSRQFSKIYGSRR